MSGIVHKVKISGPSTEPCGTPYQSVAFSDECLQLFRIEAYFSSKKKIKFKPDQSFHTDLRVYLLMYSGR